MTDEERAYLVAKACGEIPAPTGWQEWRSTSPLRFLRRLAPGEPDDRDSLAWSEWAKEFYVNAPMRHLMAKELKS